LDKRVRRDDQTGFAGRRKGLDQRAARSAEINRISEMTQHGGKAVG
jgi:hypothetical protein